MKRKKSYLFFSKQIFYQQTLFLFFLNVEVSYAPEAMNEEIPE